MPAKSGDSGKSRIPGSPKRKGDTGKIKKPSAKMVRPDKGKSARAPRDDEDEGEERAAPPRKQGMTAAKAFLLCTPITIVLLLAVSYKLWSMPDTPDKPAKIEINYQAVIDLAVSKYRKAKTCYEEGNKIEGEGGLPKLTEAQGLLQKEDKDPATIKSVDDALEAGKKGELGSQQLIDWTRAHVEDPLATKQGDKVVNYDFETRITEINMLLKSVRTAIMARK